MRVLGLTLFANKGINDVHKRSYKTHVTNENLNMLADATQGGRVLSQHAVSQVAANMVAPSAESEGVAPIVHGWRTNRFRFLLEIEENGANGASNIVYYTGYTDYMDDSYITMSAGRTSIDPHLQFHVTSTNRLRNTPVLINGAMNARVTNTGAHQLIFNNSVDNLQGGAKQTYLMRPSDIFQSQNSLDVMTRYGLLDGGVVNDTTGSLLGGGNQSSRTNNSPGTYLFNTLKAYSYAKNVVEDTSDIRSMVNEAVSVTKDGDLYYDPFFDRMSALNMNIRVRGQFSYDDLVRAFPHIDEITVITRPRMDANVWDYTNTEHWNGSNNETVAASLLVNAVPSIMLDNLVADARFLITNDTVTGEVVHQKYSCNPINNSLDRDALLERVIERVKLELIPSISMQNSFKFTILIDCSIYGDTMVNVSLNGGVAVPYVMPTFADNLASPVLTNDINRYNSVTNDIYNVAQQLLDAKAPIIQTPGQGGFTPPNQGGIITNSTGYL